MGCNAALKQRKGCCSQQGGRRGKGRLGAVGLGCFSLILYFLGCEKEADKGRQGIFD